MKPSHKKPYYYIINNNTPDEPADNAYAITNLSMDKEILEGSYTPNEVGVTDYRFLAMKEQGDRTSNQSTVNIEIHSGTST